MAAIFVDAISAFYAVVRRLVMPMDQSDEDAARLFKDLQLPPEALHELAEALSLADAVTEAGAPPTLTNDIPSTFTASHFTVRGSSLLGGANNGTRPGHPCADVVCSYAFHNILECIAVDLNQAGLRPLCPHQKYSMKLPLSTQERLPFPLWHSSMTLWYQLFPKPLAPSGQTAAMRSA